MTEFVHEEITLLFGFNDRHDLNMKLAANETADFLTGKLAQYE